MSNKQEKRFSQVAGATGIYRYITGGFYLRYKLAGKTTWHKLESVELQAARREATIVVSGGGKVEKQQARRTVKDFAQVALDSFAGNAESTRKNASLFFAGMVKHWPEGSDKPVAGVRPADISKCLQQATAGKSASYKNQFRRFVRKAFECAVESHALPRVPDSDKPQKKSVWQWDKEKPIRGTPPTVEQWRAIVASIRSRPFSDTAEESADVVEAYGLLGLGQAEIAAMTWQDVELDKKKVNARRKKTGIYFDVPLQSQAVALLTRRKKQDSKPGDKVFSVQCPKKAIEHACRDLSFPAFSPRSFRRMFITQALRNGVNVKTIAAIQGHNDGGKLILQTYSGEVDAAQRQEAANLISEAFK